MRKKSSLRVCVLALALLALMCTPALAKVVSPGPDFYYLDNANVLSEALEGEIFFANKLLYDACGAQVVVVTVPSTNREAIDDYAYELFNSWGIGDAAKDNGFLLLLAIDDDDYYARTGSGLDRRFSASTIKEYYDQYLESDFAAKRYEQGVKKFFEAVFQRISDTYNAEVTPADGVAAYEGFVAENAADAGYGGYSGSRRNDAVNDSYRGYQEDDDDGIGVGFIIFVLLIILLIVLMSKGRRARRRAGIMPPPPTPPMGMVGRPGYYSASRAYQRGLRAGMMRSAGWGSAFMGSGGSSRPSSRPSSTRSSFGGGSSFRSSSSSSRSSGFGGGSGGGGRSSGGGAGRGRH